MKTGKEFSIILCIALLSTFIANYLPLPASIISLIILFLLLILKIVKPSHIKTTSNFLLMYMPLFFIPSTVKIMVDYHLISPFIINYLIICVISTILTFLVAGTVVKFVMRGGK